jgi:tetraacyldisaccharide 4'-kinase
VARTRLVGSVEWPAERRLVSVGGATMGGSGKTPLALACVEYLAMARKTRAKSRVALVGHAYRARPERARVVDPADDVDAVGDEALACARELSEAGSDAVVVVAPTRQQAVDLAATIADVIVVDGVLQTEPRRADLALLAVDRFAPWGAGECPPAGDLRAPVPWLMAAADAVVTIGPEGVPFCSAQAAPLAGGQRLPLTYAAHELCLGAHLDGRLLGWEDLSRVRVGLYTAVARPARLLARMGHRGVAPAAVVSSADHSAPSSAALRAVERAVQENGVELWVTTAKCRTRLGPSRARFLGGAPVATLDDRVRLGETLQLRLDALQPRGGGVRAGELGRPLLDRV